MLPSSHFSGPALAHHAAFHANPFDRHALYGLRSNARAAAASGQAQRPRGVVHYFHDPADPYSFLTVQYLDKLRRRYSVRFEAHLVSGPDSSYQGDTERFTDWAHRDAADIAPFYDLEAPGLDPIDKPTAARMGSRLAEVISDDAFAAEAVIASRESWSADPTAKSGRQGIAHDEAVFDSGNQLREKLGHYFGATFYFEGEWFWGIDRLPRLESRLQASGRAAEDASVVIAPEIQAPSGQGHIRLDYFPSLRSPYTAVGHARVVDLARSSGVELVLRPVMPMMMRGVPAPRAKQRYIITDAAREARAYSVPFGRFVDPFGDPVRRAFALFPTAERLGKGLDFVTSYLAGAWADGIDVTNDAGLKKIVERVGIDWATLSEESKGDDWQAILDANVADMLAFGLWGVPSFRVTSDGDDAFSCWGQDRIWRVAAEIARRAR